MTEEKAEVSGNSSEYNKEEFMLKFKTMEADMKEIKEFMGNIMKAVETPKEPKEPKVKKGNDWLDDFFGLD